MSQDPFQSLFCPMGGPDHDSWSYLWNPQHPVALLAVIGAVLLTALSLVLSGGML